jgi:8-oxo-dGTP diphosphatase
VALNRIAAAGGVVWRGGHATLEVAVAHRPRYDDWSLPKGKLNRGETLLAGAVREVGEELGVAVRPSRRLGSVRYEVDGPPGAKAGASVRKDVTFWAMRSLGEALPRDDEVDDVSWLRPADARTRLSYHSDRAMLDEFIALPPADSVIVLVRHAKAGKRSEWDGPDAERPLDPTGSEQAEALVDFLACFGVDRVVAANRTRCIDTVAPYAKTIGVEVEVEPLFADDVFVKSPLATQTALLALAKPGHVTAVCSQGLTIPSLVDRFADGVGDGHPESDTRKGAAWVLSLVDGDVLAMDYYEDAAERPV